MPTYEYIRQDGSRFEVFQGINEPALTVCPDTGQPVQRAISGGAGVVYKGSGWYVTDYKSRGGSSSEPAGASESGSGKTGESTAAAGAETASSARKPDGGGSATSESS